MRIAVSFLILYFLSGCALHRNHVLEAKDTQFLKVEVVSPGQNGLRLTVSGLAFNSAMSVQSIGLKNYAESEINVLVRLTQSKEGLSGRFSKTIAVPPAVKIITFGSGRAAIWVRPENNPSRGSG
jgi:hypothetical protein